MFWKRLSSIMANTTRPKIFGIGYPKFAIEEFNELAEKYDIHYFVPDDRKQVIAETKRIAKEHGPFDASWVLFDTARYAPFDEEVLGPIFEQKGCGIFSQGGAGVSEIDVDWLTKRGCYVANTPYAVTDATADIGIMLMLAALRGVHERQLNMKAGKWRAGMGLAEDPVGKTIGFFGLGNIGKSMARKTKAWDMKVIYYNRRRLPEAEEKALGATYVSFDELLAQADIVSINCPLTPETTGVFTADVFNKMRDGSYLVNTARGPVVDEEALIAALKSGKLAGAGLDVLSIEPCVSSPLFDLPNAFCLPHVGAFTKGTIHRGEKAVFANVKAYFESGKPVTYVNEPERD